MKKLAILGIRGLPATHGGFETFAEYLSIELVKRGWHVTVYCQVVGGKERHHEWKGIELIDIPVSWDNALGTIIFDAKSTLHACKHHKLLLTLGYNTGFLAIYCRLVGAINVINMDGIEWLRSKWPFLIKVWFYLNERVACWFGNALIADHPEIKKHLATRVSEFKVTMIPYGAESIESTEESVLAKFGLESKKYLLVIARPEPENSLLEIVRAFSRRSRNVKLVILGNYKSNHFYHQEVKRYANEDVIFTGAIYEKEIVQALRSHATAYVHGHQVGGTNPSLVESMGTGNVIIAHDNDFNRWVTDNKMLYFKTERGLDALLEKSLNKPEILEKMEKTSKQIFLERYQWNTIIDQYEQLLSQSSYK